MTQSKVPLRTIVGISAVQEGEFEGNKWRNFRLSYQVSDPRYEGARVGEVKVNCNRCDYPEGLMPGDDVRFYFDEARQFDGLIRQNLIEIRLAD